MAPKKAAAKSSSGAKAPKAKGAAKAQAKAVPEPVEDPRAKLEKEAEELFERHEPDGKLDGTLKLAQFAEIVRAMNVRKCMIWGDDPASIIRQEWTKVGGAAKREVTLADFKAWWPPFAEAADAEAAEALAAKDAKEAAAKNEREEKYAGDGAWSIALKDLKDAMAEARRRGKTPIVIDNSPGQRCEAFFLYSGAHIVECKKMIMDKAQGKSVEEVLEDERQRFFAAQCFKRGQTVVFRLANTACDLRGTWNSDVFPSVALMDASEVAKVLGLENVGNVESSPFYGMAPDRDEALELSSMGVHKDFNVVVVTQFPVEEYEEFLKDMLPLHLMQPIAPSVE